MAVQTITPARLNELKNEGARIELIDVRTPAEYREVHVPFARNVPLDTIRPSELMGQRNGTADDTLYVICRSGKRAQMGCEKLHAAGYSNVVSVEGGTDAWVESGLSVVRGKKAMSLERQVRIAAGSLVLIGVVLGWLVHPAVLGLAAFVGAGLVFAGVTDTCGMGMLLAKMPWNQVRSSDKEVAQRSGSLETQGCSVPRSTAETTASCQ